MLNECVSDVISVCQLLIVTPEARITGGTHITHIELNTCGIELCQAGNDRRSGLSADQTENIACGYGLSGDADFRYPNPCYVVDHRNSTHQKLVDVITIDTRRIIE